MQTKAVRKLFLIFVVQLSMILMIGCAGMKKATSERAPGYLYYPSALVDADQARNEARAAGKDKECPAEFNAAKDMADKAYEIYLACRDKEAIAMAEEAIDKTKALCPPKPVAEMKPEPKPEPLLPRPLPSPPPPPPSPAMRLPEVEVPKSTKAKKFDDYIAVLHAESVIKMTGPPGRLTVWIGFSKYKPNLPKNMNGKTAPLQAVGSTAKITPYAPAFKVEPKESICMKIVPTGSEVGFTLAPTDEGTFPVGAYVQLYDSIDCSGAAIPKATTSLEVKVVVDHKKEETKREEEHKKKFWEILWDALFKFWEALLSGSDDL